MAPRTSATALASFAALCSQPAAAGLPAGFPSVEMTALSGEKMQMPLYGLGTWQYNDSRTEAAVGLAFGLGYRHVDTAVLYGNLKGVGAGLKKSGLAREDFFVTSKIPGGYNASASEAALEQSLKDLQLDYVDLMLIHFPSDIQGKGSPQARQEEWKALQEWALKGKAKAIGVSHYCKHHIEDILKVTKVPISVNQVQYHVGMGGAPDTATDDKAYTKSQGILFQSFSPLCGPCNAPDNHELLNGTLVTSIGKAHNKSGAQVALKWLVQQGIPIIPKSDNPDHVKENMELFDFTLSDAEMQKLTAANSPAVGGGPGPTDSGDCGIATEDLFVV